ncbi:hypothetical protein GCM10009756_30000 [Pseudokineococcus marinus]
MELVPQSMAATRVMPPTLAAPGARPRAVARRAEGDASATGEVGRPGGSPVRVARSAG